MFLICVFLALCIASAVNYFNTRKKRALIINIKGPLTLPLMGSALKLILLTPKNFFKKSSIYTEKFGTLSRCWAFDRLFIPTADYEFVEQLLANPEYVNTGYNLLKPWLGEGLLMNDTEVWQKKRQLLSHAFNGNMLEDFMEVFVWQSGILNECLASHSDGRTSFDIYPFIFKANLDIMIATTLGIQGRAQDEEITEYASTLIDLINLFTERFLRLHSTNNVIYSIMCPLMKRQQKRFIETINKINNEIIEEQRFCGRVGEKLNPDSIYTIEVFHSTSNININALNKQPQHMTLLDMLLKSHIDGKPLTNAEISDELNMFIFQGSLLAPSAICFALIMISRHPSVQHKILTEMQQVWPKWQDDRKYSIESLHQLVYLECVIKETLRLYPAQPIIGRELKENFNYTHSKVGDGIMPAGAEIYICLYDMLRNSEKYKDPEAFLPERYTGSMKNNNLLSFSMAPRNCIAQRFAMLLIKTVLTKILSTYEVLPLGEEVRLQIKIALGSTNGFQVALKSRN